MPFAVALSAHPIAFEAVGEVCGRVLERGGPAPDLVFLAVSADLAGAVEDVVPAVQALVRPRRMIGATSPVVIGNGSTVADAPAVALWAAWFEGDAADAVVPVRLAPGRVPSLDEGFVAAARAATTLLLLAAPSPSGAEDLVADLTTSFPHLAVIGGVPAPGPAAHRLVVDRAVHLGGAVGVLLGERAAPVPVVSSGCRPVGGPFTVTGAGGGEVRELGGRPTLERLVAIVQDLPPDDHDLARRSGFWLGVLRDPDEEAAASEAYVVRPLRAMDRDRGSVTVDEDVAVGDVVRFFVRDPLTSHDDLLGALLRRQPIASALLFGSVQRVRAGTDDVDALSECADAVGIGCEVEFGSVGGRPVLLTSSASVAAFRG